MKNFIFFVLLIVGSLHGFSQDLALYEKKWMVQNGDTLPYRVLLPQDYNPAKKYPVIFFLHGAGERGSDNEKQLTHGWKFFLRDTIRSAYPAIVVFPQCATRDYWANVVRTHDEQKKRTFHFLEAGSSGRAMEMLIELVDYVLLEYPVKTDQVYVGGLSMGGMGAFELVRRKPGVFAAAFPICGGANPATAKGMAKTRWWIFHGAKDDVVPYKHSDIIFEALKAKGAKVKFTLFPNANHNAWDPTFAEPELLPWLFSNKQKVK